MLTCLKCAAMFAENAPRWRCLCGGRLRLDTGDFFKPAALAGRSGTLWRYHEALGLQEDRNRVSLGEGLTPLQEVSLPGGPALMKLDFLCPTGSYKDRGATVMISKLKEWGVDEILEDSSGNAGASIAAYAGAAGIRADVYIPASTSAGKAAQIRTYGANLIRVEGSREATAQAAWDAAGRTFYASHNWSPYFFAGLKTMAYEIAEQLGWRAPDWVIVPAGNGGLASGVHQGFRDLLRAGMVTRLPRLAAVQAETCAPIFDAWRRNAEDVQPIPTSPTAAEGIAIARPLRGSEVLDAVRESQGLVCTVGEAAIWDALQLMGRRGLYVEPTSATAVAAACDLMARGVIPDGAEIAIPLTGSGLKATDKIVQYERRSDD